MEGYFDNTDWHQQRLAKFTASEMHRLCKSGKAKDQLFGDGAMTYIREVISESLTGVSSEEDYGTIKALEWGASQEAEAVEELVKRTGWEVEYFGIGNPQFFPFNSFSGGSPDGLTETHVIEIKCPYNSANHVKFLMGSREADPAAWLAKTMPEYYTQVQFNMMCTKRPLGFLGSYDPRIQDEALRFARFHIPEDKPLQADIDNRLRKAGEIIHRFLNPPVMAVTMIAHHDADINTTIIEPA